MAVGVPVLLHAVVPSVKRYSHLFYVSTMRWSLDFWQANTAAASPAFLPAVCRARMTVHAPTWNYVQR
jgi:hypothetical protein